MAVLDQLNKLVSLHNNFLSLQSKQMEMADKVKQVKQANTPEAQRSAALKRMAGDFSNLQSIATNQSKLMEEFGVTPEGQALQRQAKAYYKSMAGMPLNQAMALQHDPRRNKPEITQNSLQLNNEILASQGKSQDVQDRVTRMVVDNGAAASKTVVPKASTEDIAFATTKALSDNKSLKKEDLAELAIADGGKLSQKLQEVSSKAVQAFKAVEDNPNMTPTQRMTAAISVGAEGVELTDAERYTITQNVAGSLDALQSTKQSQALVDGSLGYQQMTEQGMANVVQNGARMLNQDPTGMESAIMDSVGSRVLTATVAETTALYGPAGTYERVGETIKNRMAGLYGQYDKLPTNKRFGLFVEGFMDMMHRNVGNLDNLPLVFSQKALSSLQSSYDAGTLQQDYPEVMDMMTAHFQRFDQAHTSVIDSLNERAAALGGEGFSHALTWQGKPAIWQTRGTVNDKRISQVASDPTGLDALRSLGAVSEDGDAITIKSDRFDTESMLGYVDGYKNAVTPDQFDLMSKTIQTSTGEHTTSMRVIDIADDNKRRSVFEWVDSLSFTDDKGEALDHKELYEQFKFGDVDLTQVIKRDPNMRQLLENMSTSKEKDMSAIRAIGLNAMRSHFATLTDTVLSNTVDSYYDDFTGLLDVIPAGMRDNMKADHAAGSTSTLNGYLDELQGQLVSVQFEQGVDATLRRRGVNNKLSAIKRRLDNYRERITEDIENTANAFGILPPEARDVVENYDAVDTRVNDMLNAIGRAGLL